MLSKKRQKASTEGRVELVYHRYRIIAGQRAGLCQAIAYAGKQKIEVSGGETVEAAVDSLKAALDKHLAALRRERSGIVPTAAEFREALLALESELPDRTIKLLLAHSHLPNAAATKSDLARRGDRDEAGVLADYSLVGRKLGGLLGFLPDPDGFDRMPGAIGTIAVVEADTGRAGPVLRLRPEMLSALAALDRVVEPPARL